MKPLSLGKCLFNYHYLVIMKKKINLTKEALMMAKPENRIVKNRPSPKNEDAYISAYLRANPAAKRRDGKDIAAVTTKSGEKGHALLDPAANRSKDRDYHRGEAFIPDETLRKKMGK